MNATGFFKKKVLIIMTYLIATSSPGFSQDWIPLDEVKGPLCVARNPHTGEIFPLSPANSRYNVIITDGFAKIELLQTFINDMGGFSELVYVFPLPHEASVHGMVMQYKDSVYTAEIYEREEAELIFNEALLIGLVAALLVQDKPNIFTQKIANIAYGDTAYIKIDLSLPLRYLDGEYELAVPTMIADRYQGFTNPGSQGDVWNPPADRSGQTLQFNVLFQTGFPVESVESPTHPLFFSSYLAEREYLVEQRLLESNSIVIGEAPVVAKLQTFQTYPNRDYVLRFKRSEAAHDLSFTSFYDMGREEGYFSVNLFPDPDLFIGNRPDLELVILVDKSGSQSGWPMAKEKEIVLDLLGKLQASDNFILLSFSNSTQWAFTPGESVPATTANISIAQTFTSNITAGGGTELLSAITTTLAIPITTERKRIYVFLTDGFITNEEAILNKIETHESNPTIFTFGAGGSLNRYFLDRAAEVGNGVSFEVTSNEAVGPFVDAAWGKIESPQLSNISFTFTGLETYDVIRPLSDKLYSGQPFTLFGKYRAGVPFELTLDAYRDGEPVQIKRGLVCDEKGNINSVMPQIWARHRIRDLTMEQGTTDYNKDKIIEVSIEYQILTKYTAFLAVNPVSVDDYEEELLYTSTLEDERVFERDNTLVNSLAEISLKLSLASLQINLPAGIRLLSIEIYDLQGRQIFSYSHQSPSDTGRSRETLWHWDGLLENGSVLKSGHYLIRIVTDRGIESRRIHWSP